MGELCPLTFSLCLVIRVSYLSPHHRHCPSSPTLSQSYHLAFPPGILPLPLASQHYIPKLFPFCIFACLCVSLYSLSVISLKTGEYMIFKVVNENKKLHFLPLLLSTHLKIQKIILSSFQKFWIFICPVSPFSDEFIHHEISKEFTKNEDDRYNVTYRIKICLNIWSFRC